MLSMTVYKEHPLALYNLPDVVKLIGRINTLRLVHESRDATMIEKDHLALMVTAFGRSLDTSDSKRSRGLGIKCINSCDLPHFTLFIFSHIF